jgi:hypothetical protein
MNLISMLKNTVSPLQAFGRFLDELGSDWCMGVSSDEHHGAMF